MSSRPLLASFAVGALLVVTTPACDLLKHRDRTADAGAIPDAATVAVAAPEAPVDAGAPVAPLPLATAGTSAPAPTPARSAAPAGKGDCRCLPDQGSTAHGNNMRLAPAWKQPRCGCDASGVQLCLKEVKTCKARGSAACDESFDTVCKARVFTGLGGAACQGWDSQGKHEAGRLSCDFDGVDTYPRPAGGTCTGFTVDKKQVKGHVFCN